MDEHMIRSVEGKIDCGREEKKRERSGGMTNRIANWQGKEVRALQQISSEY
jgi:hypothetical protein